MSAPSILESFDLLRFSDTFHARLAAAQEDLNARKGLEREKQWMASAVELLTSERAPVAALLEQARGLPELGDVAFEMASTFQDAWVDALEKLLAGIMFHAGSRSPVIEAIFPHQKFPALRRASKDAAMQYATEFERRLKSSYVTRMMAGEEFGFAKQVLELIASTYAKWHACFAPPPMPEENAARLREELPAVARRLERAMAQSRLIAEAALLPVDGAYEASGLNAKPRKRAAKAEVTEAPEATPARAEAATPEAKPAKAEPKPEKDAKPEKDTKPEPEAEAKEAGAPSEARSSEAGAEETPSAKTPKARKPKKPVPTPEA